ncbi:MAG: M14 family metallopeptidase [Pirellulaceae bacterium]
MSGSTACAALLIPECRSIAARPELAAVRGRRTLVPVVNEAALARGQRTAADGLDLARTCPGRPNGSITERTAHALSQLIRSADYYIDLHTGGTTLSIWPMTGYVLHADPRVLDRQRQMARAFNLPVIWGTDPALPGRSLSVARDAGVPAIYAEYLGAARASTAGVRAYVEGCLGVLELLGMLDRPAPPPVVRYVVEDPRPQSGHLQLCYPSPIAGCFEAAVELGQSVIAGQSLGTLVDPLGSSRHEVLATQTGRLLVLRTFPAVQRGDSLAVVLETAEPGEHSHA